MVKSPKWKIKKKNVTTARSEVQRVQPIESRFETEPFFGHRISNIKQYRVYVLFLSLSRCCFKQIKDCEAVIWRPERKQQQQLKQQAASE